MITKLKNKNFIQNLLLYIILALTLFILNINVYEQYWIYISLLFLSTFIYVVIPFPFEKERVFISIGDAFSRRSILIFVYAISVSLIFTYYKNGEFDYLEAFYYFLLFAYWPIFYAPIKDDSSGKN
ncbi:MULTISPECIES: hypothetical protein [unclassified Halobacteriovorax]|uniref:hypothetical protein n=1 Tax=unclassified Halobacteriovorax TaxID=2639665 RepID=UPI00399C011B